MDLCRIILFYKHVLDNLKGKKYLLLHVEINICFLLLGFNILLTLGLRNVIEILLY